MKVLSVVVLAVLGCSLAQGRIVDKCDLRNQLVTAISALTVNGEHKAMNDANDVAKFVCHAEKSAGFNTSAVTDLPAGIEDTSHQGGQNWPSTGQQQSNDASPWQTREPPQPWTLLGVFQLSNRLFCDDGQNPSKNICDTSCSNFLDDDTTDDVNCLLKFFSNSGFGAVQMSIEEILKMIHLILQPDCKDVQDSEYFAGCSQPPAP
ncbi:hypothetical protein Q5P01_025707 [Channa striata]|uniref:lysozyme n=1 Tax=Channa striata TaxID=64152 RepID=A0AA88LM21_CHASR|nr:hypothetical protein Q5P01_025707 [Channa striata]